MRKATIMLLILAFAVAGCGALRKQEPAQPQMEMLNQAFYGFPDVPVPKELEFVRDKSFIYETPGLKAGVLVFSGNVDMQSLADYFTANMTRNGWKAVNVFRHRDVLMNYTKDGRTCQIRMTRSTFNTEVEIWVGPAGKESPAGRDAPARTDGRPR
jgi:hypothetical protein